MSGVFAAALRGKPRFQAPLFALTCGRWSPEQAGRSRRRRLGFEVCAGCPTGAKPAPDWTSRETLVERVILLHSPVSRLGLASDGLLRSNCRSESIRRRLRSARQFSCAGVGNAA